MAVTIDEVYQSLAQDGLLGMALHPDLLKGAARITSTSPTPTMPIPGAVSTFE